jgi:uncharacterized protein YecE (DUF72 family)
VGGGVGCVAGGAVVGGGVAGVLSEGDFLPQTESVVAARITANAVARERGPNFIHTSNRRAATGGPGIPEGIIAGPPGARKNSRRARGLHPVSEDSPEGGRLAIPDTRGAIYIGISGYDYRHWRGAFYPPGLARSRWLAWASHAFNSIELNGTFYSLKTPDTFRRWARESPDDGFVFAVKGSRFITHNLKLTRPRPALANFFASGVLALGRKTGPFLWQLPPGFAFQPDRVEAFLKLLPSDSAAAERLARHHDRRVSGRALLHSPEPMRYRHAFEVRHPSFLDPAFYELLRAHDVSFVIADSAGKFVRADEVTASFVYVRLHGSSALYAGAYPAEELDDWAGRIAAWAAPAGPPARDVCVYFDNDALGHAPHDAIALAEKVRARLGELARAQPSVSSASREAQAARSRAGRTSRASRRTPRVSST